MSSCNPALIQAYLENTLAAMANEQHQHAEFLVQHALDLLKSMQPNPTPSSPVLSYGVALDEGRVRAGRINQDYAFAFSFQQPSPGGLFVVADGMGGHANGADASRLAVHTFVDTLLPRLLAGTVQEDTLQGALIEAVQAANLAIYEKNSGASGKDQMGTTLTAVVALGNTWYVANVGDSRTYIARPGMSLVQITEDHSAVARMVRDGEIPPDKIYTHPQRNIIYRCLGEKAQVEIDIFPILVNTDVTFLLCSDGLWEMLPDVQQIEQVLADKNLDAKQQAEHLAHMANGSGGADNIGIIVVHVTIPEIYDMPTMLVSLQSLLSRQPVRA